MRAARRPGSRGACTRLSAPLHGNLSVLRGARETIITTNEPPPLAPARERGWNDPFCQEPPCYSLFSRKAVAGSGGGFLALISRT